MPLYLIELQSEGACSDKPWHGVYMIDHPNYEQALELVMKDAGTVVPHEFVKSQAVPEGKPLLFYFDHEPYL